MGEIDRAVGGSFSPHKLRDYSVPLACAIRVVKLADATGGGAAKIRGHALTRARVCVYVCVCVRVCKRVGDARACLRAYT